MNVLTTFDLDVDFFEANAQLKIAFNDVIKTKGEEASQFMWSIALMVHPDSKYHNTSTSFRQKLIRDEYFAIDWEDEFTIETIDKFKHLCLTKQQQFLIA